MKPFIPRQPKQVRERVEIKLDARLVHRLEKYCQYLDSDRDYVLSQVLEFIFRKDKGFSEWLAAHEEASDMASPGITAGKQPAIQPPDLPAERSAAKVPGTLLDRRPEEGA